MSDFDSRFRAGRRTRRAFVAAGAVGLAVLVALFGYELTRSPDPTYLAAVGIPAVALAVLLGTSVARSRRRRIRTDGGRSAAALLVAALLLGACGDPQEVIQSGTTGTNAQVGEILLRNVYLDEPPDPAYEPGADPRVILTLVNQGGTPDTLTEVSTPLAQDVEIRWDRDCDGTAEVLPTLPLPAQVDSTSPPNAPGPTESGYFLRLVELTDTVRAGASVPITFTFTGAGTTTVQAKVDLPDTERAEPEPQCRPAATP